MTAGEQHLSALRVVEPSAGASVWMNHAQAAAYLGVGENKLREMRTAWRAEHARRVERRIGRRHVRFAAADLDELAAWFSRRLDLVENNEMGGGS
jgi:tryptophan 2,3-dioxygenase